MIQPDQMSVYLRTLKQNHELMNETGQSLAKKIQKNLPKGKSSQKSVDLGDESALVFKKTIHDLFEPCSSRLVFSATIDSHVFITEILNEMSRKINPSAVESKKEHLSEQFNFKHPITMSYNLGLREHHCAYGYLQLNVEPCYLEAYQMECAAFIDAFSELSWDIALWQLEERNIPSPVAAMLAPQIGAALEPTLRKTATDYFLLSPESKPFATNLDEIIKLSKRAANFAGLDPVNNTMLTLTPTEFEDFATQLFNQGAADFAEMAPISDFFHQLGS